MTGVISAIVFIGTLLDLIGACARGRITTICGAGVGIITIEIHAATGRRAARQTTIQLMSTLDDGIAGIHGTDAVIRAISDVVETTILKRTRGIAPIVGAEITVIARQITVQTESVCAITRILSARIAIGTILGSCHAATILT